MEVAENLQASIAAEHVKVETLLRAMRDWCERLQVLHAPMLGAHLPPVRRLYRCMLIILHAMS
jgi:hypothetical protein